MPPTSVKNPPPSRKPARRASFDLLLALAAILCVLVLTGLAWNQQAAQTPTPTATLAITQLTTTPTPLPGGANSPDETTGIILAGAFLVLIIIGGTLGATRRKS